MKKTFLAVLASVALLQLPISAFAGKALDDVHHEEERVEHYDAIEPANEHEARTILDTQIEIISTILNNGKELDHNDLETIHEISYSLENAVDKLRETQSEVSETKIDSLDEAVQALHYASEDHEFAKTKLWFGKLQTAWRAYKKE